MDTTVTHLGENKRLHLESSKQNYYIISLWVMMKAIFIHWWFLWVGIGVSIRSWNLEQWRRTSGTYQAWRGIFWTVLFRIASLVFLFPTPSISSLVRILFVCREPRTPVVKLICVAFQPFFSRLLRWLMKPQCELYLSSFSCSFFVA